MKTKNRVFIAASLDGFIADKDGGIAWLTETPNPTKSDLGYSNFMSDTDAIIMGRNTFETVCGFDMDWPYDKPVFVLSNSLTEIPEDYTGKAFLVNGLLQKVVETIHQKEHYSIYIDGGATVQNFLLEDLIDELIITTIPIILGEGFPLFSGKGGRMDFELKSSKVYNDQLVQSHYIRKK